MPDITYRRRLPHIHPEGFPLFFTFRLADSLPIDILQNLKAERERGMKLARSTNEINQVQETYFHHYDEWLDRCSSGPRWLEDESIANIVTKAISDMAGGHYRLFAYCIMHICSFSPAENNHLNTVDSRQNIRLLKH